MKKQKINIRIDKTHNPSLLLILRWRKRKKEKKKTLSASHRNKCHIHSSKRPNRWNVPVYENVSAISPLNVFSSPSFLYASPKKICHSKKYECLNLKMQYSMIIIANEFRRVGEKSKAVDHASLSLSDCRRWNVFYFFFSLFFAITSSSNYYVKFVFFLLETY